MESLAHNCDKYLADNLHKQIKHYADFDKDTFISSFSLDFLDHLNKSHKFTK